MALIEEILKYSNKHSRVIILILLGVILCGSVAGGMWIQNLNSIISEKDKILEQRIQIADKENKLGLYSESLSRREANMQVEFAINMLALSMRASLDKLKDLAKEIENTARSDKQDSQKKQQLIEYSKTLTGQAENISKALEHAKTIIDEPVTEKKITRPADSLLSERRLLLPALLGVLFICSFILNLYLLRRNRRIGSS